MPEGELYGVWLSLFEGGHLSFLEAWHMQVANQRRLQELEEGHEARQGRFSRLFDSTATESLAIKLFGITEA